MTAWSTSSLFSSAPGLAGFFALPAAAPPLPPCLDIELLLCVELFWCYSFYLTVAAAVAVSGQLFRGWCAVQSPMPNRKKDLEALVKVEPHQDESKADQFACFKVQGGVRGDCGSRGWLMWLRVGPVTMDPKTPAETGRPALPVLGPDSGLSELQPHYS